MKIIVELSHFQEVRRLLTNIVFPTLNNTRNYDSLATFSLSIRCMKVMLHCFKQKLP